MTLTVDSNLNGAGYSVRYGVQGSGSIQIKDDIGGEVTQTTISGLMASTTYSIQVAAVNNAGIYWSV